MAGGGSSFYENSLRETYVEALSQRSYSWDALENANTNMDCPKEYLDTLAIPDDLKTTAHCNPGQTNIPLDCRPCGHAMLEVWSGSQDDNIRKYAVERKTVELGGELGIDAEIGWYASKVAIDNSSALATYRGLKSEVAQCSAKLDGIYFNSPTTQCVSKAVANSQAHKFREPLRFGEYCKELKENDPTAHNLDFCSYFVLKTNVEESKCALDLEEYKKVETDQDRTQLSDVSSDGRVGWEGPVHICRGSNV